MVNSRRAAAFAMSRWLSTKDFPSDLLPRSEGRALAQDILYTAIRRLRPLRKVLGELLSQWPKGELEALLYVGAAQILYMPSIPDFAAVNETVNAAKISGNPGVVKVVNGVLRNLLRRRDEIERMLAASPLELRESFPGPIIKRWTDRFGHDGAAQLAAWHNEPAETFLAYRDGSFSALARGTKVEDVEGFAHGAFIVQDPATRHAVELLDIHKGDVIFDACAAPGGKSIQAAWRGANVVACEINPKRRRRLEENIRRTGVDIRVTSEMDGTVYSKILVDAPCSNTGVFRRRPDARWNWSEEKLAQLVRLQAEILDACVRRLAPGGRLVYSTCSNEIEENAAQVEAFLSRHREFEFIDALESVPFQTQCDGAFAAALQRRG